MMSLIYAAFAVAGLIAAIGPLAIHLLNRRRYRTVHWGAMEFLARALGRSRKRLRLRDFLLLFLRTLAIALFGLALARPVIPANRQSILTALVLLGVIGILVAGVAVMLTIRSRRGNLLAAGLLGGGLAGLLTLWQTPLAEASPGVPSSSGRDPVHAIVIIDNSQSMGLRSGEATLLDAARRRATESLSQLPPGSRISMLPLCERTDSDPGRVYRHVQDAAAEIARIPQTDQAGTIPRMLALIATAAKQVPELSEKRALFLTDLQATAWPPELTANQVPDIPLQIVAVDPSSDGDARSNLSIESFTVRDGLVQPDSPAVFLATVTHDGSRPVENVEIALSFDGTPAVSDVVDFEPGQTRSWQWSIPINTAVPAGSPLTKPAKITLRAPKARGNRLTRDDAAYLAVPVVRGLPVLFVDQYGEEENLEAGRVGETHRLRRLLAPRPREGVYDPFVEIRQVTMDQLTQEMLAEARLVVIAGVTSPTPESVPLLRDYMKQGGPILIAAGANFDPARWNDMAWRDGLGILPAPLSPTLAGVRPSLATRSDEIIPRQLDVSSLRDPLFDVAGLSDKALADLWRQPFFFQAAQARLDETVRDTVFQTEIERIRAHRANADENLPQWLSWRTDARRSGELDPDASSAGAPEDLARQRVPRVLARLNRVGDEPRGLPYLVERRIGHGRVLFLAAGISSDWDTLTQTNAIILLDRLARSLIQHTLPDRTVEAGGIVSRRLSSSADATFALTPPAGPDRQIAARPAATGSTVQIDDTSIAGIYTLELKTGDGDRRSMIFAVNGPASESDLARLNPDELNAWCEKFRWKTVRSQEPILLGAHAGGDDWPWRWLTGLVIFCLMVEMVILACSSSPRREEPS